MAALDNALRMDPNSVEARLLLARAAQRQGNQSLAESHLREVLRLDPRNAAAYQLLGDLALHENKTTEAISNLRLALLASADRPGLPERVLTHLSLATALRKEGYLSAAIAELAAFYTASKNPTREMTEHRELADMLVLFKGKATEQIGELHAQLGQHDLAAKAYEETLQESPDAPDLRARLARSLARAGKFDAAMTQVQRLLTNAPDAPNNLALLKDVCDLAKQPGQYDAHLTALARSTKSQAVRLQLAELLLGRDRTDAAMEILTAVVAEEPSDVKAHCLLARLRLKKGDISPALDGISKLLREEPSAYREVQSVITGVESAELRRGLLDEAGRLARENAEDAAAQFLLGEFQRENQHADEAVESYNAAVKLNRSFGPAWAALARVHSDRKQWQEVITTSEKAIKNNAADSATYLCKGKAHQYLDETESAETALLEAFRLDPKSPEPLFMLAAEAERRGEKRRCEQIYKRILDDVDPRHIPSRERLVRMYLNTDKLDKARDYFSDFERFGQSGAAIERCRAMIKLATSQNVSGQGRLDDYRNDLKHIAETFPNDSATRVDLAMSHVLASDFASALTDVETALKINAADPRARELRGTLLMKLLDYEGAAKVFQELLAEHPRDLNLLRNQLDLAINLADWPQSVKLLDALMARDELRGGRDAFMRQSIDLLILSERIDEAVERARKWLDDAPTDSARRQAYLTTLRAAKRTADGVTEAAKWLSDDPTSGELRLIYIDQLLQADRLLEAEQKVLAWLNTTPDDINLNGALLTIAWRAKQWDRAIELAKTGAEVTENRAAYLSSLGRTYRLAGRFDEAIDFYRARLKSAGSDTAFEELIAAQMAAERWKDAEQTIQSVLTPMLGRGKAGEPLDPLALIRLRRHLANLYQLSGRDHASIEQLVEIFKMAPADPGINNDLGYTLVDADTDMERAEKMIRLAVRERPREAAYLDSLGWLLYKQGKYREAVVYLERAIRMGETTDAVLFDHLGDALYRVERKNDAGKRWRKAMDLLNARTEGLDGIQNRTLKPKIEAKLQRLDAGESVDVATPAEVAVTTRPAS